VDTLPAHYIRDINSLRVGFGTALSKAGLVSFQTLLDAPRQRRGGGFISEGTTYDDRHR
jgi:hypothetical protein